MAKPSAADAERKSNWTLTERAFGRLLQWLDAGESSDGARYLEMRRRLVLYFDRKNCLSPDELADETLNRVARRLEEEGAITSDTPAHYCYIVARFVFLESLRGRQQQQFVDERLPDMSQPEEEKEEAERRSDCLDQCLHKLDTDDKTLIVAYYQGEQRVKIDNRKKLAARLGITVNALSIRACRIRDRLEDCVGKCISVER